MLIIIALICILLAFAITSIEIVPEKTVYVVENFGKFSRVLNAGLHFKIPLVESIAEKLTLKQQNFTLTGRYPAQDRVMIDVVANLIYEVVPTEQGVTNHTYKLVNRERSIAAVLENFLRTYIASETSQGVLQKKDDLMNKMKASVGKQFADWGINIIDFEIIEVKLSQNFS